MLLTKLEIKGFKSFGDKVTINFDSGITGIVGPNGCGKSNVVDAIRWVLGEQKTKALRSEKMENIIFNGTRVRRATNMAEVSLTFNNTRNLLPTEYSQVTITRRYYRSGESEYLLNGVTCRLKDITNLFLDTGIASNSYAIIELKMVDDILNDKDNSRRGLFEEAAGVSKFKIRKKETLKKLEDTDSDLERVEDLLFEISKNLKSLEKQAKQTEKYYTTKEEYKKLSIDLAKKTVSAQTESFLGLNKQIEAENDKKISLNKQVIEKEALVENLKADLINKEKLLASRQKTLNEHVHKIRQYESDKKIKNERLRFLTDKSAGLKNQIEQDKKSNERAAFSIQSLSMEKESAEKILAETEAKLTILKDEYETQKAKTQALQEEVAHLNKTFRNKQDEVYQLNKSVEIKQIQLSTLKQELEKASSDTHTQTASLAEFEEKVNELKDNLTVKTNSLGDLQARENELQNRIQVTSKFIEVIREELTSTSRKLDAKQNEYNLTKSLVDNLEGFPEAIKFLKKNSEWGKAAPLLSDILTCDEKYRVAIENFLEPYMNYYIVESEAQAYQAVNMLSNASKGKANFFILENFESFHPSSAHLFANATPATEIVEYDSKYRGLISFMLDNVYIVQGEHTDIPKEKDCTFITENGKVIKRQFSVSGGSVGLFEGKRIGRAKNLEKLEIEIKELSKKIDGIKQSFNDKQKELEDLKLNTYKDEIDTLTREINLINQEYVSVKTKHEQLTEMLNNNATKREDILEKVEILTDEISTLKPQAEDEQAGFKELEEKINHLNSQLVEENELLSRRSTAYNQDNILFHQQENKVNSIKQEISFKESAFETSKESIEKNQLEFSNNEAEISGLMERAEVNDDELIQMYSEKESIEKGVSEAEKEYYQLRGDIDLTEKDAREIQRGKESVDGLIMQLQNKLNETKLQLTSVKERLSVEFNINLDKIMELGDEGEKDKGDSELSVEELKEKVFAIKDRLEKLGPINPMAMEAYQEIKERHDFITTQKLDLVTAKESLMATIGEIDVVAKETFLEAYNKIKENFIRVFRSLFTEEDDCDLRLSDPENPLESTIDIIAKPKGKRPLTINQLSGGEKTLTATSLLFAIYLLKPAPFCIFDEVDAPLDDANIDKFNNIIKKFSNQSQFIIVTHNKRTMASTDVMYGVTMIEQGVSRVVPVDLRALVE
jgi:chromosome segregation protein